MNGVARLWGTGAAALLASAAMAASAPTRTRPAGDPGSWITAEDYPVSALRSEAVGTTFFSLDVSAQGHVTGCTILRGSGTDALDTATCTLLSARATFTPAMDRKGQAVASTYASSVRWRIPEDAADPVASEHFESCRFGSDNAIVVETAYHCFY